MAQGVPLSETYRGALPFVLSDMVRTVILVMFPVITLWLVRVGF
jgi:TRAP-type C4-dicarboxylate transport system permease large subunit